MLSFFSGYCKPLQRIANNIPSFCYGYTVLSGTTCSRSRCVPGYDLMPSEGFYACSAGDRWIPPDGTYQCISKESNFSNNAKNLSIFSHVYHFTTCSNIFLKENTH